MADDQIDILPMIDRAVISIHTPGWEDCRSRLGTTIMR